ncbi:hypothetical protein KR018_008839 [Drosophila ironensis]|nr:hypothetical protein KR018_008839 [Drosophila ironensis]
MFKLIVLLAVFAVLGAQAKHHWHFKVEFGRDNAEISELTPEDNDAIEDLSVKKWLVRHAIKAVYHHYVRNDAEEIPAEDSEMENFSRRRLAWKVLRHGLPLMMLDSEAEN